MAKWFYIVTIIISVLVLESVQDNATIPAIGTDCLGNDFLCVDDQHFLICVERDTGFKTADQTTQTCGWRSYCDNNLSYECASGVPVTDAPSESTTATSVSNSTDLSTTSLITTPATSNDTTTVQNITSTTQSQVNETESTGAISESTTRNAEEITTTVIVEINNTTIQSQTVSTLGTTLVDGSTSSASANSSKVPESATTTVQVTETTANIFENSTGSTDTPSHQSTTEIYRPSSSGVDVSTTSSYTEGSSNNTENNTTSSATQGTTSVHVVDTRYPSTWAVGTTTTPAPTPSALPVVCPSSGLHPHPTDCSKFIVCIKINGFYHTFDISCSFNRAFDPQTKRCSSDSARLCGRPTTFECTSRGNFPHPSSPTKYYKCIPLPFGNFKKLELPCPYHSRYDARRGRCQIYLGDSGESSQSHESRSNESRS